MILARRKGPLSRNAALLLALLMKMKIIICISDNGWNFYNGEKKLAKFIS